MPTASCYKVRMGLSAAEAAELAARRARIMEAMDGGVMLLAAAPERVRTADILYPYRQDSDFAYVTGFPEADAVCVLAPDAPERYVLFVRPHDPERAIWVGARVGVEGAVQQYGADAAFPFDELENVLPRFLEKAPHVYHNVAREDQLAARLLAAIRRAQAARPRSGTGPSAIRDPADILHELRLRKEPAELARLRQAIAIACEAHREAMRTARPGMNEFEVEALIDFTFRRRGAVGPAYASIVAGGANATVLHYTQNDRPLDAAALLLVDAGAEYAGYCADVTRTWPVERRYEGAQLELYDAVLAAQPTRCWRRRPTAAFTCTGRATGSGATCTTSASTRPTASRGRSSRAWCSPSSRDSTFRPTPRTCRRRSAASASGSRTMCS